MDPEQIPIRDLHLPDAIGWWPPAPGWWLLAAFALAGLFVLLRRWLRTHSRGAVRRRALRELDRLLGEFDEHRDVVRFASAVSSLLRRAMLAYAPRAEVAGLTGDAWLHWLDRGLAHPQFVDGPGRRLLELPYRRPDSELASAEIQGLVSAVRQRIATPPGAQA